MAIPELGDPKDPGSDRDYTCDWTPDLAVGETLVTSTWAITPPVFGLHPLVVDSSAIDAGSKIARVYLSGGDPGNFYEVANTVTTSASPTEDVQRFILFVQER